MKVAVVGGKLQGVEAAYLAKQAGWQVLLIDKFPHIPAKGLADSFFLADITDPPPDLPDILHDMDLIVPALEKDEALNSLNDMAEKLGLPLVYDKTAYAVTSSKYESGILFDKLNFPVPRPWPECGFPVIVKPSGLSGSRGIRKIDSESQWSSLVNEKIQNRRDAVVQEYCEGPSYSLEVIGDGRHFVTLQPTVIEVDRGFDCKRVTAPAGLPITHEHRLDELAVSAAAALQLRGIMDIEVILHQDELKVLEIDARLPSQTPTVVLKSTGINMLELLYGVFGNRTLPEIAPVADEKGVIFEHIRVKPGLLETLGEHIVSEAGPLSYRTDFFGADEALTDFESDRKEWVATLIMVGSSKENVIQKRSRVLESICEAFGLAERLDFQPDWRG